MTVNAVQYELGNKVVKELVEISDHQYFAYMDNLKNILFEASMTAKFYEEFDVTDFVQTENFNVLNESDIEVSKGTFEFAKDNQKIIWHLGSYDDATYTGTFMSGSEATMTIKAELNDSVKNTIGLFDTNEKESIQYHLFKEESKTVNSTLTPKLYNGYTVYYEGNPPTGCNINANNEEIHSVLDIVKITDEEPVCDGYQFKGWKIVEEDEVLSQGNYKINDTSFRMPAKDIHLKGTWTKLNIKKSMSGAVYEVKRIPLIDRILENGKDPNTGKVPVDNVASKFVTARTGIDFANTSSDTNGKGLYIRAGSENDINPIYYYRGNVTNNNVLFAGFCWKIVRTTETGGIKLAYNRVPVNNKCETSSGTIGISNNQINQSIVSPAYHGYMYGTPYAYINKKMSGTTDILTTKQMNTDTQYYFTKEVPVWDGNKYILSNTSDGTNSFVGIWETIRTKLYNGGYYTCLSATIGGSCMSVFYIAKADANNIYYFTLSNNSTLDTADGIMTLGRGIQDNGDGTYTLTGTTTIKKSSWYSSYANYRTYYACSNFSDTTCDALSMYYITSTTNTSIDWTVAKKIVFGNDVRYENGIYTLVDTATKAINYVWGTGTIVDKKHYTCLSSETVCDKAYYIYYRYSNSGEWIRYIELNGAANIDGALEKMFTNTTDSTIKKVIDTWYKTNIKDKNYSNNLENAVWCNDRSISEYGGWNKDLSNTLDRLYFRAYGNRNITKSSGVNPALKDNLACPNVRDCFTTTNGTDKGNGNGDLTYPVGMLTADELSAAGFASPTNEAGNYLPSRTFWSLTPCDFASGISNSSSWGFAKFQGKITSLRTDNKIGIVLSISLKSNTKVLEIGDGSATNPYRVE